jgi:site-specific recombinase XerD
MHAGEPIIDQWASWLAMDAPRRVSPATIREYCRHLARFASWIESTLGLPFLPEHVTAYRMERYLAEIEGQIQQKQRKHAMYNKAVAVLTSFGMWLVSAGYITETPARRLRTLPEQPTPIKALDRNVVIKVLDAAHHTGDLRDALVLELLAHSGMRAHEVAAIHVEDLEVGRRSTWVRIVGKGQKQRRIPLPKPVGILIQDYLQQRVGKEGQRPIHGPLLVGERGGITRTTINRIVAKVAMRAQLSADERRQVTPHAFRHTVATRVVRRHDLIVAADLLGHSSLTTTRRYAKASAQELEAAVEALCLV